MATSHSTAGDDKGSPSYIASVGGYVGILFVTVCSWLFSVGSRLADEYQPPEQRVHSAVVIAVVAAVIVAAIVACAFPFTNRVPRSRLWLPSAVSAGLILAVVLLNYHASTNAVQFWKSPSATGDSGRANWELAVWIALACPFVAAALTGFRAGAARMFLVVAGLTSLAWLGAQALDQAMRNQ